MTDQDPYIVGFSDSVHDRSVCLFQGARPVVGVEEERLTRRRYAIDFQGADRTDPAVFAQLDLDAGSSADNTERLRPLVDYCLGSAGIDSADVRLWIGNSLHSAFPFPDRAVFVNHHLAHAASAFYGSGAAEAAVLVADGYGDAVSSDSFEAVSLYHAKGGDVEFIQRVEGIRDGLHLCNSAGILYRIATLLSGFGVMEEGKTMGLAAHGKPRHLEEILRHISFGADAVAIDNDAIWRAFRDRNFPTLEERADVAASFQEALEQIMLQYARLARDLTGCDTLCMAGGVALNCVANQRIADSGLFSSVWVFPAAADNGISFGAAYLGAHRVYGLARGAGMDSAFLGRSYGSADLQSALGQFAGRFRVLDIGTGNCAERAARHIADGGLVMWFQGGSEIGPRALGHRSIFGDPRSALTRDHINAAVKSREMFRPLAPIVLEEEAADWFHCTRSPFMLFTPRVREHVKSRIPAVVHVDGTARVQTLRQRDNPEVHRLLRAFQQATGIPMVINTSFNLHGEPIVESPAHAVRAFGESPVTVLCLDGLYVEKLPA
ncbi:MAG TPA: carbamoyltransferase C-terminal domain-containing protein [Trebonia sp.]|jgi:carbamoyltransferase|nr:carbamoyltransferase C-terminal domain-containing protein [Trebonia sp.]